MIATLSDDFQYKDSPFGTEILSPKPDCHSNWCHCDRFGLNWQRHWTDYIFECLVKNPMNYFRWRPFSVACLTSTSPFGAWWRSASPTACPTGTRCNSSSAYPCWHCWPHTGYCLNPQGWIDITLWLYIWNHYSPKMWRIGCVILKADKMMYVFWPKTTIVMELKLN